MCVKTGVTYSNIAHRLDICGQCERALRKQGKWVRNTRGEFCNVHHGRHVLQNGCELQKALDDGLVVLVGGN